MHILLKSLLPESIAALEESLTPNDIHKLADSKGIEWDNEPSFLKLTKKLTGKEHLDDLDQAGLQKVKNYLEKQKVVEAKKRQTSRSTLGGYYGGLGWGGGYGVLIPAMVVGEARVVTAAVEIKNITDQTAKVFCIYVAKYRQ